MRRAVRRIDPKRAALLLIAAALALAVVPFDRPHAQPTSQETGFSAPSGLSATAADTSLTLSWTAVTGATSYEVKLGASGAATTVSSGTSHTFSNLTTNTSYTLYVRAKSSDNISAWSSISATTLLAAPSGLSATASDTVLTLFWDAVSGATSYEVKLGASGAATTVSSGTGHTFSSLTANTSYTLYVRAKNSGGVSGWSSITKSTRGPLTSPLDITAPTDGDGSSLSDRVGGAIDLTTPAAPSGLSATATSASLTLSWTHGSPGMTGTTVYEVKRGDGGAVATPSGMSHTFSGLTAGTEYTLYVRSRLSSGASEVSDWVSLDAATAPAAPSGLSAAATSASLTLSWTAVSGATSYEVKRGASGAAATVSSGTSHTFSGLSAGTSYTLYARAKNSGGASDWSSLTAITAPATPDASLLRGWVSGVDLGLSWWLARVTGATSYEVKLGPRGAVTTPSSPPHAHLFTGIWAVREEYTLYVRARNSGGASDWAWITYSGSNPPLALTGLSATATAASLTLSWTSAPSNKTTYEVKLGASGTVATVAATGHTFTTHYGTGDKAASKLSHTFTGLAGGAEYTLYVRAKNSGGSSPWSSISATTSLAAPSGLSVDRHVYDGSKLKLSWSAVTSATSYEVKQGASGAATAVSSDTSHIFSGLAFNTSYTLYVRAKNASGTSDWASITRTTMLATPQGLSVTATSTSLTLSWSAVAGATGYEVWRSGTATAVSSSSGTTSNTFSGLTTDGMYTLYVRAKNSSRISAWNSLMAEPCHAREQPAPATGLQPGPTCLVVTANGSGLKLSWRGDGSSSYEFGYRIRSCLFESRQRVPSGATSYTFGADPVGYCIGVRTTYDDGTKSAWSLAGPPPGYQISPWFWYPRLPPPGWTWSSPEWTELS